MRGYEEISIARQPSTDATDVSYRSEANSQRNYVAVLSTDKDITGNEKAAKLAVEDVIDARLQVGAISWKRRSNM